MADFSVSDVASRVKGPEGISLGDMMNMAIGAQKLKQAEKINPLLARQQEALTTEAEETLQPKITQKKAESESATYGANTAKLKQIIDASTIAVQEFQQLHKNPTYDGIVKMATDSINNSGQFLSNEDKQAAITKAIIGLNPKATKTELQAFIAQKQASVLSAQAQAEKLYPTAYMQDTGKTITPIAGGNPLLTGIDPTQAVGTPVAKTITPSEVNTVIGTDAAGNPIYAQKNPSGNIQGVGVPTPIAPANAPAGATMPVIVPAGQTGETYKGQATSGYNLYQNAIDTMTNPNSKAGYLPAKKQVTDNIIKLLKDPTVDTGPITNYFAGKTGQESLTPKEQELAKYLEQRIQNQNPSSQMDLQSKHTAYGSINLKKDALVDLIRNEKATQVTSQDLLNRGIIRVAGNQQNPNINAINGFKDQFAMYANDPTLMKLISLTGEKQKAQIDQDDKIEINKLLQGMTKEQKQDLLKRRENVLRLVNGE
jgi:hypothetical protein